MPSPLTVNVTLSDEDRDLIRRLSEEIKKERGHEKCVRQRLLMRYHEMHDGGKEPTYMGVKISEMDRRELLGVIEDLAKSSMP